MQAKTIEVDPSAPQPHLLQKAVDIILAGGIIVFPTDTTYGLGVNPFDDEAVSKVFKVKQRDPLKPLLILISEKQQLDELTTDISDAAKKLTAELWPGALTLIFKTSKEIANFKIGESYKIGIRLPDSALVRKLSQLAKIPITASSANPSGQPSSLTAQQALKYFGKNIDLIIDGGPAGSKNESTVLDVSVTPPLLIREGVISLARLNRITPIRTTRENGKNTVG